MNAIPTLTFAHVVVLGAAAAALVQAKGAEAWPSAEWDAVAPASVGMDVEALERARDYALRGGGSGMVTRHGRLVMAWGDTKQRYDLKSTSKSIGMTAMGLAMLDGKLSLDDRATDRHPQLGRPPEVNAATGWLPRITLLHLATQTAGFEKPGGYGKLLFEPGTQWHYSDAGPNWLAEIVTLAYRRDASELLFERVFAPIGITPADLVWRANAYRDKAIEGIPRREFGSGVSANVDAMARLGLLYLRNGTWCGERLLPADFVLACGSTPAWMRGLPAYDPQAHGNAAAHYGLLWWNNADGALPGLPRDAFWSWGLYDSLIVVIPSLDIVAARAGQSWPRREGEAHYAVLAPFLEAIAAATQASGTPALQPPYPPSPVISGIAWAPAESILRDGEGSDNWPLTWADDDAQYTAYGDGWGFEPKVPTKLSMGFARVLGMPPECRGENIRSVTGEAVGDGRKGKKASGILMVDGRLYLWARNADNSQLAWSDDRGRTWEWAAWRFSEGFGAPSFLNFGPDYAGARDGFVYVYSFDSNTAYDPADRIVLARVPKNAVARREAYDFLQGFDAAGEPVWTSDIAARGAVFTFPGRCYRLGVTYNAGLRRYLLCLIIPGKDTRFEGGFGIYDAPEPWGPWTTVFFTEKWDVGPGETGSLPTRWMSPDGRTVHLVFSGNDCFSVRQAVLQVAPGGAAQ